jgi:hypothetical protein
MKSRVLWLISVCVLAACALAACSASEPPPPPPPTQSETLNQQLENAPIGGTPSDYAGKGTLLDTQMRELERAKKLQADLNKAVEAKRDAIDNMDQ